jgi:hypothetical protein
MLKEQNDDLSDDRTTRDVVSSNLVKTFIAELLLA